MEKKKKIGLTTAIFIGLLTGAVTGILLHYVVPSGFVRDQVLINGIFYVVGNGFLRLMQMLVVPLYSVPLSAEVWLWEIRKSWEKSV